MTLADFEPSADYARALDSQDELAPMREQFAIPQRQRSDVAYLCGHSLGLMPLRTRQHVTRELDRWADRGVDGHFDEGGWYAFHERFAAPLAGLLGTGPDNIVAMNSLTVNLHLMLVSFFAPAGRRRKILIERGAFPSDRYAVQSHLRLHGLDPVADLIELDIDPAGSETLADALNAALSHADGEVALVVLPGVQFLTGHVLPVASLCAVAHQHGARIGLDLAHSIGNVVVELDQADADFAVWCSYKYLNAGPGAIGGCWVHSRWHDAGLPRFEGWWGHAKERRFELEARFRSIGTMEAWQLSNPPILAMAPLEASLESFAAAGFGRLCAKSAALTGYLQRLIESTFDERITVLTPPAADARGCQLSLRLNLGQRSPADFVARLDSANVTADWRAPDILRLAPVPLYNSFLDVHRAVAAIDQALGN